MLVDAEIEVERGDEMVLVTLEGDFERVGSYNPHERGMSLSDWDVTDPPNFKLTPKESEYAVEALYSAMRD